MTRRDRLRELRAAAGGAALLGAGIREALRLRTAGPEEARARARQLGTTRIGAAVVLLARPQTLPSMLGLPTGPAAAWLTRLLAVRELVLGAGTVSASRKDADPWPWLVVVSAVDAAEALALLVALRRGVVEAAGGWGFFAADVGSAAGLVAIAARRVSLPNR